MCKQKWSICNPFSALHNQWFWENIPNVVVYLQPGINGEAASRGVHAGNILNVVYFFQNQLISVIPAEHTQGEKKNKSLFNCFADTSTSACARTPTSPPCASSWYGRRLSWRVSEATSFLSISYLKSSKHIFNGLTVSNPVSQCLAQWNHVQNGLAVSERWATKSFFMGNHTGQLSCITFDTHKSYSIWMPMWVDLWIQRGGYFYKYWRAASISGLD